VAPGIGFGEYGDGHVRIGLVENEQRIRQAARNVKRLMQNADQIIAEYEDRLGISASVVPHPSAKQTSGAGRT
ncbi:MAG TPA: aminotransferase, partial [Rhodobiaceae bacterium]|nr:aminotransferase [Rhodobiaceae bacterium]